MASVLEVLLGGEDAAPAHLSDSHCWIWASPLKKSNKITSKVWESSGSEKVGQTEEQALEQVSYHERLQLPGDMKQSGSQAAGRIVHSLSFHPQ